MQCLGNLSGVMQSAATFFSIFVALKLKYHKNIYIQHTLLSLKLGKLFRLV